MTIRDFLILRNGLMIRKVMYINGEITRLNIIHPAERRTLGLPTDWEYGDWPKSGEIDIMENVGYDPDTIVGSSHTEKYNHAIGTQKNAKIACPDCYKAFHVYALEWEEDEYRLYVDDQLYFTFKNEGTGYEVWPYDKRFHILLNLAIGGNWGGQKGIDDSLFPHVFEIDYVRVYKK